MIMTALISGLSVAIPSVIATILSNKKTNALMSYRIDQLEKKVNEYYNILERMYEVEKEIAILKDEMKGKTK